MFTVFTVFGTTRSAAAAAARHAAVSVAAESARLT